MKLTNTLTKQKQPLKPRNNGHVSLYTCGPTVYHYYHIGNLRNAVFNDTLKRTLLAEGSVVHHVMNITDVGHLASDADSGDDKLQTRANEENKSVWEVAEFYTEAFKRDMAALNVVPPTQYIKATSAVDQQIAMVEVLLAKGYAYQAKQAIYFDTRKLNDYGKLTGQIASDKEVGARDEVVTDPEKRHPQDFALWFFTVGHFAEHVMRWPSPWGEGFPGWHLECSAIIEREFGETIDIHTGGVDHIGTHHTNEIAQSEAAHDGAPLANLWIHIEFLLVDGRKMSKSLQNTYTLTDILERGFSAMALRLLYLQSHYRSQQNFTWESLEAASNLLSRIHAWADGQFQAGRATLTDQRFNEFYEVILDHFSDDLNTPGAMAEMSKLLDTFEQEDAMPTAEHVKHIEQLFGLQLDQRSDLSAEHKAVLQEREAAREAKDYEAADRVRGYLQSAGIEIDDTPSGPRWRRI